MSKIIIVQHCQSEHHINNMSGGWTDTPLTELGRKQADLIAQKLNKSIDAENYLLYSSDLMRAKQTAEVIGATLKLDITLDMGLREINTGVAAGKTKEWAKAHRNPQTGNGFDLDYREFQDGETWRQFYSRVCNCMDNICNEKRDLILVTHGCTLGYIIAWWINFEPEMLTKAYFSASS